MELSLLEQFADPTIIHTLSFGDKMEASLMVTALGMLITFTVLILLWGLINVMSRVVASIENKGKKDVDTVPGTTVAVQPVVEAVVTEEEDEELIAVISAAVAASLNTSIHNIVVRNVARVDDPTPAWGKSGRVEQMNTRF